MNIPVAGEWDQPRRLGNLAQITRTYRTGGHQSSQYFARDRRLRQCAARATTWARWWRKSKPAGRKTPSCGGADLATTTSAASFSSSKADGVHRPHVSHDGRSAHHAGVVRANLPTGLVIAAILVYLVMVAQFRSFPGSIDRVVDGAALGFIGVVAMLYVTGTNLSIMAFMGIIMMVGIGVEYSIVLVDFANRRVADGLSAQDAILDAARIRLRPILMTSLTTWTALLPMAIDWGGGGANAPLARAIIGGVLAATVLSLTVVPCLYVMMKRVPRAGGTDPTLSVAAVA